MGVEARLVGLDKCLRKIKTLEGLKVKPALTEIVRRVQRDAKGIAPVDTGRLVGSISTSVEVGDKDAIGRVFTNVEYAKYQEFGTSRNKAQPYMFPAYKANEQFARKKIAEVLGTKLGEVKK